MTNLSRPVYVSKYEAYKHAIPIAENIVQNNIQSRGQGIEEVLNRTIIGTICELGTLKSVGGQLNPNEFDYKVRETYGWDILTNKGNKIEVKRQKFDDGKINWFSLTRQTAQLLINNIVECSIDYVVTCDFENYSDTHYKVYFKYLINASSFRRYVQKSNYKDNIFYYNHFSAIRNNDCVDLSPEPEVE